ncbi:ATP-binding protein [uncultured Jatrophihabitans sp.]|uniref:ATP-binding protein n=1 Tax=uncultured Jatrophihabitans sp. TaxID=1610747 RepID=UPI0035CA4835
MTSSEAGDATLTNDADDSEDVVEVRVPARVLFVSTLRRTAASLAASCDLTVDDIEDLSLAVDEACALLLPHSDAAAGLECQFRLGSGSIAVSTSVRPADADGAQPDRGGFAWTVLDALASSVDVAQADGRLAITVTKRSEAAPQ